MNIIRPNHRLIRDAQESTADALGIHRRDLFKLGAGLALGGIAAHLVGCGDETMAMDSGSCTEPDPTDGDKVIELSEGEEYEEVVIKVPVDRVSRNFGMMEIAVPSRQMLVPHTHTFDDQVVYVITGELVFEFGGENGERLVAPQGSYVIKPRGLSHGFWNETPVESRYIELSTRASFEAFVINASSTDDEDEINQYASDAGITFHYEEIPRILLQNQLLSVKGMDMPTPDQFVPREGFFAG